MDNKLITGIIGVVVVVALLGSALVPVIDGLTEGEKTKNEGAGWIRMDYVTGASYSVDVSFDAQGNVKVDYGVPGSGMTDTQTHAADEDTILFASSELTMWLQDGVINILGKDIDDKVFFDQITESGPIAFLTKDGSGSEFNIDAGAITGLKASTWAYVPKSTGNFGFFAAETPVDMKDYPVAATGAGYLGVYAYNDLGSYQGLGLQLQTVLDEDGKLIGATWGPASEPELSTMNFDPSTITIQPLDPSVIDPIDLGGGAQLMAVPTPTYNEGDWGYDLITVDGATKAVIVSYSGAGGDMIVPASIGGYDVYRVGRDAASSSYSSANVINNSSITSGSTLTISEGIVEVGNYAFNGLNKITGLTIPSTIQKIGNNSFYGVSNVEAPLVIPESVTNIYDAAFAYGIKFTSLTLPSGITSIPNQCFMNCKGLTGTLVIPDGVTSIGDQAFNTCQGLTEIVIPASVSSMGSAVFSGSSHVTTIITAQTSGGTNMFSSMGAVTEVLDLTPLDLDTNRYGLSTSVNIETSPGDAIGYVSFVEIGTDPELSGGAAALLIAVPIVVIAGLLVAFVGYSIVKRY